MRSLILIKPDAVRKGLVGHILTLLESKGKISGIKMRGGLDDHRVQFDLKCHYAEHTQKDFFPRLLAFMLEGPFVAVVVDANFTDLVDIRDFALALRERHQCENPCNLIHASDSTDAAIREVDIWFPGLPC